MNQKIKKSDRTSEPFSLKEAFEKLLESYQIKDKFEENKLINSWEELMGLPIARRTEKIYIKDKILLVKLTSAPLRHELTISKSKVIEIIVKRFGEGIIDDIKFM